MEQRRDASGRIVLVLMGDIWALPGTGLRLVQRAGEGADYNRVALCSMGTGERAGEFDTGEQLRDYLDGKNKFQTKFDFRGTIADALRATYPDYPTNLARIIAYKAESAAVAEMSPRAQGGVASPAEAILERVAACGADKALHASASLAMARTSSNENLTRPAAHVLSAYLSALAVGVRKELDDKGVSTFAGPGFRLMAAVRAAEGAAVELNDVIDTEGLDEGDLLADLVGCGLGSALNALAELELKA